MNTSELIERVRNELGIQLRLASLDHNPLNAEGEWQGPSISYFVVFDRDAYLVLSNNGRDNFSAYHDTSGHPIRFPTESDACEFLWSKVYRMRTRPHPTDWVSPSEEEMRLERERREADFERRLAEYNREHGITDGAGEAQP